MRPLIILHEPNAHDNRTLMNHMHQLIVCVGLFSGSFAYDWRAHTNPMHMISMHIGMRGKKRRFCFISI